MPENLSIKIYPFLCCGRNLTEEFDIKIITKLAGLREILAFDNFIQVAVNRILFRSTGCIVYRLDDTELIIDHLGDDANGVRACLTSSMYRSLLTAIPDRDKIKNLLDIGANAGGFSLLVYLMGIPLSRVVCIEMNPRVFGRLAFNLYQNLNGVSLCLINSAIAAKSGTTIVSLGRGCTGESLFDKSSSVGSNTVRVELLSFDDIVNRAFADSPIIDLCKIDVEGSEYEVFLGTECSTSTRIRYLIIEIHQLPGYSPEMLIKRLQELGFDDISPKDRSEQAVFLFQNRILLVR